MATGFTRTNDQSQGRHHSNLPRWSDVWKHWNVIEAAHLYDGPHGIRISPEAGTTVLRRNAIHVDGDTLADKGGRAVVIE